MKTKTLRPFGFRDKIGYMFGDFGNDFTFILSTMLLMKFYTDVMGVSARQIQTMDCKNVCSSCNCVILDVSFSFK